MVMAAYLFVYDHMRPPEVVPQPVVVETGPVYSYNLIESSITVPANWTDTCLNQEKIVYHMAVHFNAFKNGLTKYSDITLHKISHEWKCIK